MKHPKPLSGPMYIANLGSVAFSLDPKKNGKFPSESDAEGRVISALETLRMMTDFYLESHEGRIEQDDLDAAYIANALMVEFMEVEGDNE